MPEIRRYAAVAVVCAALVTTAACSSDSTSSSASAPTQAELTARMEKDTDIAKVYDTLGQLASEAGNTNVKTKVAELKSKSLPCLAKGLQSTASSDKLRAYVDGDRSVQKILDASQRTKFQAVSKACFAQVIPK